MLKLLPQKLLQASGFLHWPNSQQGAERGAGTALLEGPGLSGGAVAKGERAAFWVLMPLVLRSRALCFCGKASALIPERWPWSWHC